MCLKHKVFSVTDTGEGIFLQFIRKRKVSQKLSKSQAVVVCFKMYIIRTTLFNLFKEKK